jgi:CO/xanthine dehydrogenase FAD-binding subunit
MTPSSLDAVLQILADSPDRYTPIAGGTELMVALGAGRLQPKKLVSLWNLDELRFIEVTPDAIIIGAGSTFTDIRKHPVIANEFSILAQAASWTGSIANQNRGTLGGNIVNASPAADSPPALLAYDAQITLISTRGARTLPYRDFHLAYKETALEPDELVYSVTILRNYRRYKTYIRKVGTRNAQAISKVALAVLARMDKGRIEDIRIGAASVREYPARLAATEKSLTGKTITPEDIATARATILTEVRPIDDIRSTAKYRAAVAANLLEEFLLTL